MRFPLFAIATLGIAVFPLHAQETRTISSNDPAAEPAPVSATAPVTATAPVSAAAPVTTPVSRPLPVASVSYESLKKSYKVNTDITLSDVRTAPQDNAGRIIEVRAGITGVMTTPTGRTVIIQSGNSTAMVAAPDRVTGGELLRSASTIKALLLVGNATPGAGISLTLLAASANIEPESLFHSPYEDDVTIVPPTADVILPQPRVMAPPIAPRGRTAPAPVMRQGLPSGDFDSQKPAYKNLVRRFNRKLTDAQNDEIATALLRAGYANNMDPRFLAAIIAVESDFDIYCLSSSGAMGLGQLMPFNLKEAGITNAWNPTQNIMGTARLLRGHLNDYRNRPDGTLLAVAAYNAGPGAVRRAGYKVPPGSQVQRYVWKVYYRYKEFAPELFASR